MNKKIKLLFFLMCMTIGVYAQRVAVKTNLLYGGVAHTPNMGFELALGKRSTLDVSGGYNPWNLDGSYSNNRKLVHWLGHLEYRYWLCERFSGHFIGVHALGSQFNISGYELPLLFGKGSKYYRYQGFGYGGGISYGYNIFLAKRWSIEATVGIGYSRLKFDKYNCNKCGNWTGTEERNYFGPTKVGLSLIYYIK